MITALGPIMIGAVVGWMLYYFMRLYRLFSPKTLAATLAALFGGEAIAFLNRIASAAPAAHVDLWYFLGVGAGFFSYAMYAGVLSLLFAFGRIRSMPRFQVAVGCGAGIDNEGLAALERLMEFERLATSWHAREIADDEFRTYLPSLGLTVAEYRKNRLYDGIDLEAGCLKRFETEGFLQLLPTK